VGLRPALRRSGRRPRPTWEPRLPKRNYGYEKRQKELHKQQKREEKLKRKLERADAPADEPVGEEPASSPPTE